MVTLKVAVDAPQHTGLSAPLDYLSERTLPPGTLINVPFGKRNTPGVVWDGEAAPGGDLALRPIAEVLDALPALSATWRALVDFAAAYYQRSIGEIALAVLPPELRKLNNAQLAQRIKKLHKALTAGAGARIDAPAAIPPARTHEQAEALSRIAEMSAQATRLMAG